MPLIDTTAVKDGNLEEYLRGLLDQAAKDAPKPDPQAIAKTIAEGEPKKAEMKERTKTAFLRSLAARPSTLNSWEIETLASGSQLAKAATATGHGQKLQRVNVSSSKLDDLMIIDSTTNQIHLAAKSPQAAAHNAQFDVASFDVEGDLQAVLPMRLNLDALSDLVVLRKGATVPSVVISAPLNDFTVNSTTDFGDCLDSNPCSLRSAILLANASLGFDFITFNFGGAVTTISPASQLPVITDAVTFIGPTDDNNHPTVEISGANVPAPADGLKIRGSNITIQGLAVNGFQGVVSSGSQTGGSGITIETTFGSTNSGNNWILLNHLGNDPSGNVARGNSGPGLNIFDADENVIGSSLPDSGNVISGNGTATTTGVGIAMTAGNSNTFQGNIIGLNAAGNAKLGNSFGLFFAGANNTFGGVSPTDGNTVSGNGRLDPNSPGQCAHSSFFFAAMVIATLVDQSTNELLTQNNNIAANFFGTNPGGTLPLGNCLAAILTSPLHQTTIGSVVQGGRNIISDNGFNAVACSEELLPQSEGGFCAIAGNNIGVDVSGAIAMPNNDRNYAGGLDRARGTVDIFHNITYSYFGAPGGTTANGACTGFCNLYSSNNPGVEENIYFSGRGTIGIFNNYIGTNQQGNQALPNYNSVPIFIGNALYGEVFIGAVGTDNNNTPISLGNLISGNSNGGIGTFTDPYVNGPAGYFSTMTIQGNRIGTDASGILAIPNGDVSNPFTAISVRRGFTEDTLIGGAHPLARNIISGNLGDGIGSASIFFQPGYPTPTRIFNNLIGVNASLNALGNGGNGIGAPNGYGLQIGGTDQEANQIAYNGTAGNGAGIVVGTNASATKIRNNSIHHNAGLGIDLGGDGVTANDCQDADTGANELQNFPLLDAPVFNANGTVTITGALLSNPLRSFAVDFYASTSADPSGHGEGETHLGSVQVTTDGNGLAALDFTSTLSVPLASLITATATTGFGSTSEFSCVAGATCDGLAASTKKRDYSSPNTCGADAIVVNVTSDEEDDPVSLNNDICDVFTDAAHPGPQCTLRAAIQVAEHRAGVDRIEFAIPGSGVKTISPLTNLPPLTQPVVIDGASQGRSADGGMVQLDGSNIPNSSQAFGLQLLAGSTGSTINALVFNKWGEAIDIKQSDYSAVTGCLIGTTADGLSSGNPSSNVSNGLGISIQDSNQVVIGSGCYQDVFDPAADNLISANVVGVTIQGQTSACVIHNKIGTDKLGLTAIPNERGIDNESDGTSSAPVLVKHNLISGNLIGIEAQERTYTIIDGNLIGTRADGEGPLLNSQSEVGILLSPPFAPSNTSSILYVLNNVIVGNTSNQFAESGGILLKSQRACSPQLVDYVIQGNHIGITMGGTIIPNRYGILADNVPCLTIGDGEYVGGNEPRNWIAGNLGAGILLKAGSDYVEIKSNFIGVDTSLDRDLGNLQGIYLSGVNSTEISGNFISGNDDSGILVEGGASNKIHDNQIGAPGANDNPVISNNTGITIYASSNNTIYQNKISNNDAFGILLGNSIPTFGSAQPFKPPIARTTPASVLSQAVTGNEVYLNDIQNNSVGIGLSENAKNNLIGRVSLTFQGNRIFGNTNVEGYGIFIGTTAAQPDDALLPSGNKIAGNLIGVDDALNPAPNNVGIGVYQAQSNTIGGDQRTLGNVIASNLTDGVRLSGSKTSGNLVGFNRIYGNGGDGVLITSTGRTDVKNNSVHGNEGNGINVRDITELPQQEYAAVISGNKVGVDFGDNGEVFPDGNGQTGIRISNVQNLLIGVSGSFASEPKNIITSNGGDGILLENDSHDVLITNSVIGTTESGAPNLGNANNGIHLIGVFENTIGGVLAVGNIVSGNQGDGIFIDNSASNKLFGNRIGIFPGSDGNVKLGNGLRGVRILGSGGNEVGASILTGYRNFIGGNALEGLLLQGPGTQNTLIKNNFIGTDLSDTLLGNSSHGVLIIDQAQNNLIGGSEIQAGNTIAHNGGSGVALDPSAGPGIAIDPNVIYGNAGLGIDLRASETPLPNDPGDADEGPNRQQNYPEFISASINASGDLVLQFKLDSAPANSNYGASGVYIEFFKTDSSPHLQGQTFLGSSDYTVADYNNGTPGVKVFNAGNAASLGIVLGDKIVATATDADGNTSEFTSVNVGVVTDQPTASKLASFTATNRDGSVLLNWQSGLEVDNLGFNVYREVDGVRTRITPQVVAGSALSDGPGTSLLSGHNYYWADTPPAGKVVRYWLEDIDLKGKSTFNGPYSITNSAPGSAAEAQKQSLLISQIGMRQSLLANGLGSTPVASRGESRKPIRSFSAVTIRPRFATGGQDSSQAGRVLSSHSSGGTASRARSKG